MHTTVDETMQHLAVINRPGKRIDANHEMKQSTVASHIVNANSHEPQKFEKTSLRHLESPVPTIHANKSTNIILAYQKRSPTNINDSSAKISASQEKPKNNLAKAMLMKGGSSLSSNHESAAYLNDTIPAAGSANLMSP